MKRIRRRTRNKIIGAVSTLSVLVLGVIMVTVFTKADGTEFDKFVVGDAQNYGIIAYQSMEEDYEHSASNFATLDYKKGPTTSTGAIGKQETSIIVGNIADDARFSMNDPGKTTVYGPESIKEIVARGGGKDADLTKVNDPTKVTFVGETYEEIEAQIAKYVSDAREYGESVVYNQTPGALLGFLDGELASEPTEPDPVVMPTEPTAPEKPSRIDELEREINSLSSEDLKKFTDSSDYIAAVAEAVSGGSVEADFVSLVEKYYEEWDRYEAEYAKYKDEVKKYKADLKAYNKYLKDLKKYEKDLKKWNGISEYTSNLKALMIKHHYGTKVDLNPETNVREEMVDENFGNKLKDVVIVDVLDCEGTVAYVDMDPFFNSDADERLWYGKDNCVEMLIYKRKNQTIVFNSSASAPVCTWSGMSGTPQKFIPSFFIVETDAEGKNEKTYQGGSGYADDVTVAKSIIWNFTSTEEVCLKSNNIRSTIIAPDARVNLGCDKMCGHGWIICDSYYSKSEWYYVGTPKEKETSTPIPTVTPTVTPTVVTGPSIEYTIDVTKAVDGVWPDGAEFKFDLSFENNKPHGNLDCIDYKEESVYINNDTPKHTQSFRTIKFDISKFSGYESDYYSNKEVEGKKRGYVECCEYNFTVAEDSTYRPADTKGVDYDAIVYDTTPRHIKIWVNVEKDASGKIVDYWLGPKEAVGDAGCTERKGATSFTNKIKVVTTTTPPTATPTTTPTTTPPTVVTTTTPPTVVTTTTPPTVVTTTTPPTVVETTTPPTTEAPTATPVTVEQFVPLAPATPEPTPEQVEVPNNDVPLAAKTPKPTKTPLEKVNQQVPLSAVPETGDSMNPIIPIAGMGISFLAIIGVVVLRKKKTN